MRARFFHLVLASLFFSCLSFATTEEVDVRVRIFPKVLQSQIEAEEFHIEEAGDALKEINLGGSVSYAVSREFFNERWFWRVQEIGKEISWLFSEPKLHILGSKIR